MSLLMTTTIMMANLMCIHIPMNTRIRIRKAITNFVVMIGEMMVLLIFRLSRKIRGSRSTRSQWIQRLLRKTDEETYPPRDWYNTTDPALYIEYYQAQLIKQFGDIPEVYVLAEFEEKMRAEIPMTLDEQIEQAEALYALWPHQETKATLEILENMETSGHPFVHRYHASPETTDPFHDVTPFVEQHGLVEGIQQLSKVNPKRAAGS